MIKKDETESGALTWRDAGQTRSNWRKQHGFVYEGYNLSHTLREILSFIECNNRM